ncbi:MAG: LysM peptidoglycan-binding domain-containing protein [Acidimicrobiia bacterium]
MMRHLNNMIRGLAALLVSLLFVFGVPAGLIAYVGSPLPTTLPTLDQIQLTFRSGIDPQLLVRVLAVIVWIVWAQLIIVLTVEVAAAARGRSARPLPVLPGLQPAVAQLVAAITLAATLGPFHAAPAAATPLPAKISLASSYPVTHIGQEPARPEWAEAAPQHEAESQQPLYRVTRHDALWHIAETTLGDGRRWNDIRALNVGRTMPDGHSFTETTDRLRSGWELILPDDATTPGDDGTPTGGTEVTVEPGDNFWTIAEKTLEAAWDRPPSDSETSEYWRHLVATNRDRLAPPHDPNLIYPDQRFELPPIPTDPQTETAGPTMTDPHDQQGFDAITVKAGDSFWSIAEVALAHAWDRTPTTAESTTYWKALVDVNRDRLTPPHDPNLIHPGQRFRLPAIPGDPRNPADPDTGLDDAASPETTPSAHDDPDTAPNTPAPDLAPATTLPTPKATAPTLTDPVNSHEAPELTAEPEGPDGGAETNGGSLGGELLQIASALAGLGVLAAGIVALLRRLRAAQLRHRRPGVIPTPPPPDTAPAEAMIRRAAAPTATEFIDLALRVMARDVIASHIPPPQVVGIHLTPDMLRLLLWTPHQHPPPGWLIDDDGRSWTMPTATDIDRLRERAHGVPAPYPALVTVGHGDHTQLLLDLEYLGATQVTGDPDDVTATCYTMATELAASPIADELQIICIGFGADLDHLERVHAIADLTEILPSLEAKAAAVARVASPTPLQGRISSVGGDTWDPIVIFHPTANAPDKANRLLSTAHAGRGVAAVVGYPTGDRWRLHIEDGIVRVEPLGHTYARRNLTPTEQSAVADLITAAQDLAGLPPELTSDPLQLAETFDDVPESIEEAIEPTLFMADETAVEAIPVQAPEMKVLGTLRVDGSDGHFPLRRCTELVAYLTFHRGGVEADTLMEALWPEQRPDYQRLNRHTSRTRTTLGLGPDGEPYLPYVSDGIYRISPHLRSDIEQFTGHIRQADRTSGAEAAHHLHAALEVVEGTPFTGAGNAYTWAHTDGIITHTIVAIDNAAHRLAQHALNDDDTDQATWAARKGLIATGACEECYRNLMRAAAAEGNQVAFEAIYSELMAVIDADEGPDAAGFLDPETIELYEAHNRRRRRQAG